MKRGAYKSLASRYHLKALILARNYWSTFSTENKQPVGVRTKKDVLIFKNKMELHRHIARVKDNIRRMMNEIN